jgi:hypothetical protein
MNLSVNEKPIFFTLSVEGTIRGLLIYSSMMRSGERESERCQYSIVAKVVLIVEFFCQSEARDPRFQRRDARAIGDWEEN